jgi:hypothetical protein
LLRSRNIYHGYGTKESQIRILAPASALALAAAPVPDSFIDILKSTFLDSSNLNEIVNNLQKLLQQP